jgi:hypothetical protein
MSEPKNEYVRHTLATIAYRFQKSVSRSTNEFGSFNLGHGSRKTAEIVNHIYHVLKATKDFIQDGKYNEKNPENLSLELEIKRVNAELHELDNILMEKNLGSDVSKRLLQGPLADILTHIGQISMMSRLNGYPIDSEDFASAPIKVGTLFYFK